MVLEREYYDQYVISISLPSRDQRNDVPNSIKDKSNKVDPGLWGTPAAAFPSNECDIVSRFGSQQLVIDITLWYVLTVLFEREKS
jgi:hypothetical protein